MGKNMKILVVEDDPMVSATLCDMLDLFGHEVMAAGDAQEAWTMLSNDIHMIISDLGLPGMDGLDFLAKLRQDKEFGNLPFIVLTARPDQESMHRAKLLGANDYLFKPFSSKTVLGALEKVREAFLPDEVVRTPSHSAPRVRESISSWEEMVEGALKEFKSLGHKPGLSF